MMMVGVGVGVNAAPSTTPAPLPDAERLQKLEQVTEQLSRQLMLQQLYIEEKSRSEADSGLKQLRMRRDGVKSYNVDSFAGHSIAALHDHSGLERTPGLGELIVQLNGVEFRTRHNDYKIRMPVHNTSFHMVEDVPFPPVPPSVLRQDTVEKQTAEMQEYFKAWKDSDHSHRDYRPYFKPVLCYLEGAWTLDQHMEEPFSSDRHAIEASSWFDLQEKIRYTSTTGDRLNSQNFAYLPTTIYNITDGVPNFAQWNYRILCHPLKGEVNRSHLVPLDDLGHRMGEGMDYNRYLGSRMTRFTVDEQGGRSRRFQWNELDDWMYQIPGKDNYGAHMTDDAFGMPKLRVQDDTPINVANYHRTWRAGEHDAMGDTVGHRGFADRNLFVAESTQPRIAPTHVKHCYREHGHGHVCKEYTKRMSYAIPLEVIFLTPLNAWNPYNLQHHGKFNTPEGAIATKDGRNGGTTPEKAFNGTNSKNYALTPEKFFSGAEVASDKADTTKGTIGVLDRQGVMRRVKTSGIRTQLPNIPGVGVMRLRYPIVPVSVEGSPIWKELTAVREVLMDMDHYKKYMVRVPEGLHSYNAVPSHH